MNTLLNTTDYSIPELILFCTGCFMWIVVYLIYVKNIYKNQFIEMPVIAAGSNFAWEWIWGFAFHTDMGLLCQWFYQAWIIIDLYIIYGVFRYGYKQFAFDFSREKSVWITLASILFFSCIYYFMVVQGFDTSIGSHTAYVCQFILSGFYLGFIISRKDVEGFSPTANWLRTYGTGLISVFMFLHYTGDYLLHTLCVGSFVLDNLFLYVFYQKRREQQVVSPTLAV